MGTWLPLLSVVCAALVLALAPAPAHGSNRSGAPVGALSVVGATTLKQLLEQRVVGGKPTTVKKYPFMVSVQRDQRHICGGSLYTTRLAITAAHCTYNKGTSLYDRPRQRRIGELAVVMGTSNRRNFDTTAQRRGVLFAFPHKKFNPEPRAAPNYDIALLMMSHEVSLTQFVQLVPLKLSSDPLPRAGTQCTVVGWGIAKPVSKGDRGSKRSPSVLREVNVEYLAQCPKTKYPGHVCAYTEGKDACMGDSGGPFLCKGVEMALVSFGFGCAQDDPGYYYRVDDEEWLADAERRCLSGGGGRPRRAALGAMGLLLAACS